MHGLGDADLDLVAALPRARDVHVRTGEWRGVLIAECAATGGARSERRERRHCDRVAIHLHREGITGPRRAAQMQCELLRSGQRHRERRAVAVGEARLHREAGVAECELRGGGDEEIDPGRVRGLVVDAVAVEGVTLHPGADAAGEVALHVLVFLLHPAAHRDHVRRATILGVHRREDVIEERALVEVGVERVGTEPEEPTRELEHVVVVARLARAAVHAIAQLVGIAEILREPVSARGVRVMLYDAIPEERRRFDVGGVAGVAVTHRGAHELRDLTVAVLAVEVVLMALEGVGESAMFESDREIEPALIAGVGIEIGEHFVHPTMLGEQHLLHLRVTHRREHRLGPFRVLDLDVERGGVPRVAIRVAQAGEGLVQGVPRGPEAVEIEATGADVTLGDGREGLASPFECAEVAVAVLVLHFLEFADEVVGARLVARVAGGREHETHPREVMSRDVSGQVPLVAVPPGVPLGLFR